MMANMIDSPYRLKRSLSSERSKNIDLLREYHEQYSSERVTAYPARKKLPKYQNSEIKKKRAKEQLQVAREQIYETKEILIEHIQPLVKKYEDLFAELPSTHINFPDHFDLTLEQNDARTVIKYFDEEIWR